VAKDKKPTLQERNKKKPSTAAKVKATAPKKKASSAKTQGLRPKYENVVVVIHPDDSVSVRYNLVGGKALNTILPNTVTNDQKVTGMSDKEVIAYAKSIMDDPDDPCVMTINDLRPKQDFDTPEVLVNNVPVDDSELGDPFPAKQLDSDDDSDDDYDSELDEDDDD
jgi:hypothetical protein